MADLIVRKQNEVYYKIECDLAVREDLDSYFKYRPDGYKWHPRFKAGIWDGFIPILTQGNELPIGLHWELVSFCREYGYQAQFTDNPFKPLDITRNDIRKYINWLNPLTPGSEKRMILRDYQMETIYKAIKFRRANIISPTSSGKTVMMYAIARFAEEIKKKTLIIVPNVTLVTQSAQDMIDYGYDGYVHTIFSGRDKTLEFPITVSTWQSLKPIFEKDPSFFDEIECLIVDEAHGAKDQAWVTKIMAACKNAYMRYGMTGTFPENDLQKKTLIGYIGPVFNSISIKKLMEKGHVAPLKIMCTGFKYDAEQKKHFKHLFKRQDKTKKYHFEMKYIREDLREKRDLKIAKICQDYVGDDENVLILFNGNEYGKHLEEKLTELFPDKRVFLVYGAIKPEERDRIKDLMKTTSGNILVASYQTFSTGVNIPNLHHLMFGTPSKSTIRVLQSIGRGIRLHESKDHATLWDLYDELDPSSYSLRHMNERLKIYNSQNFDYKFMKI